MLFEIPLFLALVEQGNFYSFCKYHENPSNGFLKSRNKNSYNFYLVTFMSRTERKEWKKGGEKNFV